MYHEINTCLSSWQLNLSLENIKDGKSLFDGLASIDTYVRDEFVQGRDSNDGALEILKKILRIHPDDTTPYYETCINERRKTYHTQVENWITKVYQWPVNELSDEAPYNDKEKYKCLLTDARFSRRDYRPKGALLENTCLVDCIKYTCLNCGGSSGPRLEEIPDPVPRSLMALTHAAIMYRLAKLSDNELSKGKEGKEFSRSSVYYKTYRAILDPNSSLGRRIHWLNVSEKVHEGLRERQNCSRWSVGALAGISDDDNNDA